MATSVHRPAGVMDAAVVAQGDVTPSPKVAFFMVNAPHDAMGVIQTGYEPNPFPCSINFD